MTWKGLICHKTTNQPTTWFDLVSLFNGISTFIGYSMPKLSMKKDSNGTI